MADGFENIEVGFSSQELIDRVTMPIDMKATAGSLHLIYSGAVRSAVDNVKIGEDNINADAVSEEKIKDNAISTNKIANSAITSDKISSDSVTTDKIQDGAVSDDKLQYAYWKKTEMLSVANVSILNDIVSEGNSIYRIQFTSSFPYYEVTGDRIFVGFVDGDLNLLRLESLSDEVVIVYNKSSAVFEVVATETEPSFVNLSFNTLSDLYEYNFKSGIRYSISLGGGLAAVFSASVVSAYIVDGNLYVNNDTDPEKYFIVNLTEQSYETIYKASDTLIVGLWQPVQTSVVAEAIDNINFQLDGLEELLASI